MKDPIDYFFQTSPKNWVVLEAIALYDTLERFDSFVSLLLTVKRDVTKACVVQPTFKKQGLPFSAIIDRLINMDCLKTRPEEERPTEDTEDNPMENDTNIGAQTTVRIDTLTNHGEFTNHGVINVESSKRALPLADISNETTGTSSIASNTLLSASVSVQKGSHRYVFDPPFRSAERRHMPKIQKGELETLHQLFIFGTQYCISNSLCKTEYDNKHQQTTNSSLTSLGIHEDLTTLLCGISYENFVNKVSEWKGNTEIIGDIHVLI